MEDSVTGSQLVGLGNFKDTMKNGLPRSLKEDSRMHTKCCAALHEHLHQHKHQELPRSRAKNNKSSIWDTMVVT